MKYFILLLLLITLFSCKKDKTETSEFNANCEDEISYSSDIQSIITSSCATSGCHNAASAAAGYVLENHEQMSTNADIMFSVIRHDEGVVAMPIGASKLSDEFINEFFCWMEQGKQNN